jgi:hypothetical protein
MQYGTSNIEGKFDDTFADYFRWAATAFGYLFRVNVRAHFWILHFKTMGFGLLSPIGQVGEDFYWALFEIGNAKKDTKSDFQCTVLSWYAPIATNHLKVFQSMLMVIWVIFVTYIFKGRQDIFIIYVVSKTPVVLGKDEQEF